MPIHKQNVSVTNHHRAIELFCDRVEARTLFIRYLNEPTPRNKILFFHGDGGQGKSLLLKYLREKYCIRVNTNIWQRIAGLDALALLRAYHEARSDPINVPSASIDFGALISGEYNPHEVISALSQLRRDIAKENSGFHFPLFDYALALQLFKTNRLNSGKLKELLGSYSVGITTDLLALLEDLPASGLAVKLLGLLGGRMDKHFTLWLKKTLLPKEKQRLEHLALLDPLTELPLELPALFAADLEASLAGRRVVLFFDTHEAFWGSLSRQEGDSAYHSKDLWLRSLLRALISSPGIVAVVAGRDKPRWAEAPDDYSIPDEYVDLQLIGHLETSDAREYLQLAGISDLPMIEAVLKVAEVNPGQHHPLYLGLSADVVLVAREVGLEFEPKAFAEQDIAEAPDRNGKGKALLARLLKYCDDNTDDAVKCMAAARGFDEETFYSVAQRMHFTANHATFVRLSRFSFVRMDVQGRYHIHELIRRILRAKKDQRTAQADAALEAHYLARSNVGDLLARVEALYHAFQREPIRAFREWHAEMEAATDRSQHQLCLAMGELLSDMQVSSLREACSAWVMFGMYMNEISSTNAASAFRQAEKLAHSTLSKKPYDAVDWINMGEAKRGLAEWKVKRSDPDCAADFRASIVASNNALLLAPSNLAALNNLGLAEGGLAGWLARGSDHDCEAHYWKAIDAHNRCLTLAPEDASAWANLGVTQAGMAAWLAGHKDSDCVAHYHAAIDALNHALALAPDDVAASNNLGGALDSLARWQLSQDNPDCVANFRTAIETLNHALALAPDYVAALNNLGLAEGGLAGWLARGSDHDCEAHYWKAIDAHNRCLTLAPEDASAWANLGVTQAGMAAWLAGHKDSDCVAHYHAAIDVLNHALALAPEYGFAWINLGNSYLRFANWLAKQNALDCTTYYQSSINALNRALAVAQNDPIVWNNLGYAQKEFADWLAKCSDPVCASLYQTSIDSFNHAQTLAPEYVNSLLGSAFAHLSIFDWLLEQGTDPKDLRTWLVKSVRLSDRLRELDSEYPQVHEVVQEIALRFDDLDMTD